MGVSINKQGQSGKSPAQTEPGLYLQLQGREEAAGTEGGKVRGRVVSLSCCAVELWPFSAVHFVSVLFVCRPSKDTTL